MRHRVVITGMGCVSPLGNETEILWTNLLAGKSGVGPITHYDSREHKTHFAAEVKDFDGSALFGSKEARRMDLFTQYALAAAHQAVRSSGLPLTDENLDRTGILIGTGIGGLNTMFEQMQVYINRGPSRVSPFLVPMMLPDTASAMIAIELGMRGPNFAVVSACATGTNAIGEATEVIRRNQARAMLAGGSEAVIMPIAMASLGVMGALSTRNNDPERASRPFDLNRDGFVMGEGAAVLVLEELEAAEGRGAPILAEILGYGMTNDAFHISAPAEKGVGAARCMQMALQDAGLEVDAIDYINAHGTSTPLNDKSETAAIKTVFGERAYQVPISSTKSMTGHLLGASGALEAVVSVLAIRDGVLPPTINYETPDPECDLDYIPNVFRKVQPRRVMSNSFGFGGHNATIIIGQAAGTETSHAD